MKNINDIKNKIHLADSLEFMRKMPSESVDAVVTDPPFGLGYNYDGKKEINDTPEDYGEWIKPYYKEIDRILKPGGFLAIFQSGKYFQYLWEWFGEDVLVYASCKNWTQMRKSMPICFGFDPIAIKYKPGADPLRPTSPKRNMNFFVANSSAQFQDKKSKAKYHPCPRPIDQMNELIVNFTLPGGLVLDPFVGSGSTTLACKLNGREYIGIDIDKRYADLAESRTLEPREEVPGFTMGDLF